MKAWFFKLIRPLFVKDIDPNEDFNCCKCGKPVLKRYLYCSKQCARAFEGYGGFSESPSQLGRSDDSNK